MNMLVGLVLEGKRKPRGVGERAWRLAMERADPGLRRDPVARMHGAWRLRRLVAMAEKDPTRQPPKGVGAAAWRRAVRIATGVAAFPPRSTATPGSKTRAEIRRARGDARLDLAAKLAIERDTRPRGIGRTLWAQAKRMFG